MSEKETETETKMETENEVKTETPKLTPEQRAQVQMMAKRMLDVGANGKKPLKYAKRGIDNSWGVPRGQIYGDFYGRKYVKDASGVVRKVSE